MYKNYETRSLLFFPCGPVHDSLRYNAREFIDISHGPRRHLRYIIYMPQLWSKQRIEGYHGGEISKGMERHAPRDDRGTRWFTLGNCNCPGGDGGGGFPRGPLTTHERFEVTLATAAAAAVWCSSCHRLSSLLQSFPLRSWPHLLQGPSESFYREDRKWGLFFLEGEKIRRGTKTVEKAMGVRGLGHATICWTLCRFRG